MSEPIAPAAIRLHVKDPRRYPRQFEFLRLPRKGFKYIKWSHYVGGRGCAKTTTGILLAVRALQELCPGRLGMWTEPIVDDLWLNFWPLWQEIVPSEYYYFHKSQRVIEWLPTSSRMVLRALHVDNSNKEPGRGPNLAWLIIDEAAKGFDSKRISTLAKAVRDPQSKSLFIATLSTPKTNGYQDLVERVGHEMIHATSFDNPFLSAEWRDALLEDIDDPAFIRQEVYGEFVAQSGRVWSTWSDEHYPKGNVMRGAAHDKARPYYLFADIGLRSAYLIVQRANEGSLGTDPTLVVTAEFQPGDEPTNTTLSRIDREYGAPQRVFVGADVNTKSIQTGITAEYLIRQLWGAGVQVLPVTGDWADKELQYSATSALILDTSGRRRLTVAEKLKSHDSHTRRGIRETMARQTWPEKALRSAEFFDRDKQRNPYIDTCDALCYGAICLNPPRMRRSSKRAA